MSTTFISTKEMSRAEWLEWRRKGIGGSDAAAVAGISPWKSRMGVYLDKIGALAETEDQVSEAAYWGQMQESLVAQEFAKVTGLKVRRVNAMLQSNEHPFMLANLDRVIMDDFRNRGILECKTCSVYRAEEWAGDRIPDEYMLQFQHYYAVTGRSFGYIAVLIGGQKFVFKPVERDEELIKNLIQIEKDFWGLVESKTPPLMNSAGDSDDVLKTMFPSALDKEIILPESALPLIAQFEQAKKDEAEAKERKEAAEVVLKGLLGDAAAGMIGNRLVTWKNVKQTKFDTKLLKEEMPEIYGKYERKGFGRRFDIK